MAKIRIAAEMVKELAAELRTSRQTVYAALSYFNNSEHAQEIRQKAKDKMLSEANNIVISVDKNNNK